MDTKRNNMVLLLCVLAIVALYIGINIIQNAFGSTLSGFAAGMFAATALFLYINRSNPNHHGEHGGSNKE